MNSLSRTARETLWWIGLISGTLSMVILVEESFGVGLAPPLQAIVDLYEQVTRLVIGQWSAPLIKAVTNLVGFRITLAPVWKQVFIVLFVAASEIVRIRLEERSRGIPSRVRLLGFAALFAFLCGALWGTAQSNLSFSPYIGAFSPLFVLSLTDLLVSAELGERFVRTAWRFLGMFLVMFVCSLVMELTSLEGLIEQRHDLTAIGTLFVMQVVASYAIASGRRVGQAILVSYLGAAIFFLADAGLKLAGQI